MREEICGRFEGYEVYMQELDRQLQEVWAQQCGQRPLPQEKATAEAHHERMQKAKEDVDAKWEKNQRQREQLDK